MLQKKRLPFNLGNTNQYRKEAFVHLNQKPQWSLPQQYVPPAFYLTVITCSLWLSQ